MESQNKENIEKIEILEAINRGFSAVEVRLGGVENRISNIESKIDNMVTKDEFLSFKLETNTHFNNIETDLKSFKTDTNQRFDILEEKVDDLLDTSKHFDKRIETLKDKVLV